MIATYVDKAQKDWDVNLPLLTSAYRSSVHVSTGYTPNMLMLGREVHLPIELVLGGPPVDPDSLKLNPDSYAEQMRHTMTEIYAHVREHLNSTVIIRKRDYDTRIAMNNYKVGDVVYLRDSTKTVGLSPKLKADVWKGPFIIIRKFGELLFEVKNSPTAKLKVVHHDRLKPYLCNEVPAWLVNQKKKLQGGNGDMREGQMTEEKVTASSTNSTVSVSCPKKQSKGRISTKPKPKATVTAPSRPPGPDGQRRSQRKRKPPEFYQA